MSAIAGLWCSDGRSAAEPLERMLRALEQYGPDASHLWAKENVGVGRRLMSIFPEDARDRQPLTGGNGRFTLVADVRLDNRQEVAAAIGLRFKQGGITPDAMLVLAAFERWGEECVHHLYGDYAFALWDRTLQRWFLARDAMGGKPLHYFRSPRVFAFASMPKGLHALPEVPYEVDEDLLARALDLTLPTAEPVSCFRHISRVGMGEYVIVTKEGEWRGRHWNPSLEPLSLRRPADYHEGLRAHLDRAVDVRLPVSGDVGAHLSAGLDSSAVAATAARLQAKRGAGVTAFTAVPRDGTSFSNLVRRLHDEGPTAAKTAALYENMEHVLVTTRGRTPLEALASAFELYEQPFLNLCNQAWLDAINDAARARGLSVVLTGQLGNFTLSYGRNGQIGKRRKGGVLRDGIDYLRRTRWSEGDGGMASFLRESASRVAARLTRIYGQRPGAAEASASLLNPARRAEFTTPTRRTAAAHAEGWRPDRLSAMRWVDLANGTKATLARWRIHQLDPTADRRFVEFCLAVPEEQFRLRGLPSAMARLGLADRLPPDVLQLRVRGLQAADWYLGIGDPRQQLGAQVDKLASCPETASLLDTPRLTEMVERWPSSGWNDPEVSRLYRTSLLRAISYGDFLRRGVAAKAARSATKSL